MNSGQALHDFMREIFPLRRSITGEGTRATLRAIAARIRLELHEVKSGTAVLDWTVPDEWSLREAWIEGPDGRRVVDLQDHALHVVGYSEPVDATLTLEQLQPRLHSIPERPDWIPYRTSYWKRDWGFCMADRVRRALPPGEYRVKIDADLAPGSLSYGECFIPGRTRDEVLISAHICHPQLANDNQAGVALAVALGEWLGKSERRYSYRLVFAPGTIGAIVWLARNGETVTRIKHGLIVACVGVGDRFHYKRSRRGDAEIDRVVALCLAESGLPHSIDPFTPYGYDERQYCSPGFNLPVGSLTRTPWGQYPEYHTSADDLSLVTPDRLAQALALYQGAIEILELNRSYLNLAPQGEPQLGRRGLFRAAGGRVDQSALESALLWVLNLSDGTHSLLDIAERSGVRFGLLAEAAAMLQSHRLLSETEVRR